MRYTVLGDVMKKSYKKPLFFLLIILFASAAGAVLKSTALPSFSNAEEYCIILDAGHGAPDGGAVGVSGTEEKDINLDIVLKLQEILEGRGAKVILTRSGDSEIYDDDAQTIHEKKVSDMRNRKKIMDNSDADLFLSIHMNAFSDPNSGGLHVFYARNHPECEVVATKIQDSIAKLTGAKTHAVKTASDSLYLMKNPVPPSILVECGFISNPEEERLLNTDQYRAKIAFGIADAVYPSSP